MSIDLQKALKAPFAMQNWFLNVLIGGVIFLVPILNFAVLGYLVEYLLNFVKGKEELPGRTSDNLSTNFITGAKNFAGLLIVSIVLGIVTILIITVSAILFSKLPIITTIITFVVEIIMSILLLFLIMNFSLDKKILSTIDVKRTMNLIKGHTDTTNFIVQIILLWLIYGVVMVLCIVLIIPIILVPFLSFTACISTYNLMGQYLQKSPYIIALKSRATGHKPQQQQQTQPPQQPQQ